MLRFVLQLAIVLTGLCYGLQEDRFGGKIVGGRDASIEEFPWQISLRRKTKPQNPFKHTCGGSVLTENIILTAAHCVIDKDPKQYVVVAGSSHRTGGDGVISRALQFVWHEGYNSSTKDNDVALILLESSFHLDNHHIKAVKLATRNPRHNELVTISGWGSLKFLGSSPEILQVVNVPTVSNDICAERYAPSPILDSMICAGSSEGGKDACQGDSGGPLVIEDVQYGIVSWGRSCALATHPGVYSSVAHLRQWIEDNVQKLSV